jgi:hypothetical protein
MAALNMRPYLRQRHRAAFEETLPGVSGSGSVVWRERITDTPAQLTQHSIFEGKHEHILAIVPGTTAIELEEVGKRRNYD